MNRIEAKLIELLKKTEITRINGHRALAEVCFTPHVFENMADHLIANGVTVQRWIPVTERLPIGADGKSLCENVVVYFNNGEVSGQVCTGWLNGDTWYLLVGEDDSHTLWDLGAVTHWMPLPEPPKED